MMKSKWFQWDWLRYGGVELMRADNASKFEGDLRRCVTNGCYPSEGVRREKPAATRFGDDVRWKEKDSKGGCNMATHFMIERQVINQANVYTHSWCLTWRNVSATGPISVVYKGGWVTSGMVGRKKRGFTERVNISLCQEAQPWPSGWGQQRRLHLTKMDVDENKTPLLPAPVA